MPSLSRGMCLLCCSYVVVHPPDEDRHGLYTDMKLVWICSLLLLNPKTDLIPWLWPLSILLHRSLSSTLAGQYNPISCHILISAPSLPVAIAVISLLFMVLPSSGILLILCVAHLKRFFFLGSSLLPKCLHVISVVVLVRVGCLESCPRACTRVSWSIWLFSPSFGLRLACFVLVLSLRKRDPGVYWLYYRPL